MRLFFILILLFPNLLFSWSTENIKAMTENCIEKTSAETPQFSNEFIIEYCEWEQYFLKNSMTWDEFLSLYENNQSLLANNAQFVPLMQQFVLFLINLKLL